jgi:predicted transcriptional regulator
MHIVVSIVPDDSNFSMITSDSTTLRACEVIIGERDLVYCRFSPWVAVQYQGKLFKGRPVKAGMKLFKFISRAGR